VRALGVVVLAPALDHGLCLGQTVEDLAVQELVSELRVEALALSDIVTPFGVLRN
jgi:hypothetical protein